jgi:hypothetical protein
MRLQKNKGGGGGKHKTADMVYDFLISYFAKTPRTPAWANATDAWAKSR